MTPEEFMRQAKWYKPHPTFQDAIDAYTVARAYNDERARQAIERLSRTAPEHRFEDSLTDWDRDFLRTNRIQP